MPKHIMNLIDDGENEKVKEYGKNAFSDKESKVLNERYNYWYDLSTDERRQLTYTDNKITYIKEEDSILPPYSTLVVPKRDIMIEGFKRTDYVKRKRFIDYIFDQIQSCENNAQASFIVYYKKLEIEDIIKNCVVGIAKVKDVSDTLYYERGPRGNEKDGYVWARKVQSTMGEKNQGFRIPLEEYEDDPEVLEQLILIPNSYIEEGKSLGQNNMDLVNDAYLVPIIQKLIEKVEVLIKNEDTTYDWNGQKEWLINSLNELLKGLGRYPSFTTLLEVIAFSKEKIRDYNDAIQLDRDNEDESHTNEENLYSIYKQEILDDIEKFKLPKSIKEIHEQKELVLTILPRLLLNIDNYKLILKNLGKEVELENGIKNWINARDLLQNPYLLSEQFRGKIKFEQVDIPYIYNRIGIKSKERIRGYIIEKLHESTSTYMLWDEIVQFAPFKNYVSYISPGDMKFYQEKLKLIQVDDLQIYLQEVFYEEKFIKTSLIDLMNRKGCKLSNREKFRDKIIEEIRKSNSQNNQAEIEEFIREGTKEQAEAITKVQENVITIISGRAGCGKTSVIKEMIKYLEGEIVIIAPTGKARARIQSSLDEGSQVMTIHKLLANHGWYKGGELHKAAKVDENHKQINISNLIIDECSMIDQDIMYVLMKALNKEQLKKIVFIGDIGQLPPIGKGKIFQDMIDYRENCRDSSHKNCYSELTYNFRQIAYKTDICNLAQVFRDEKENIHEQEKQRVFKIKKDIQNKLPISLQGIDIKIWDRGNKESFEEVLKEVIYEGKRIYMTDDAQILAPYNLGIFGTKSINKMIQKIMNTGTMLSERNLIIGDKVIQTQNKEDKCVYNGQIGVFKGYEKDGVKGRLYKVKFKDKEEVVRYTDRELAEQIELAYAITTHKSQGSEYRKIIYVLPEKGKISRQQFYTALTRAKEQVILLVEGDIGRLEKIMEYSESDRRKTTLFIENIHNKECKIEVKGTDEKVRNISEKIIYEELLQFKETHPDFEVRYESEILLMNNKKIVPDFVIQYKGEKIYWEHFGLVGSEEYDYNMKRKIAYYKSLPNKFIATYGAYQTQDKSEAYKQLYRQIKDIMVENFK